MFVHFFMIVLSDKQTFFDYKYAFILICWMLLRLVFLCWLNKSTVVMFYVPKQSYLILSAYLMFFY